MEVLCKLRVHATPEDDLDVLRKRDLGLAPYKVEVDDAGNLWLTYSGVGPPPLELDETTGDLYYVGPDHIPNPFYYDALSGELFYDFT